MFDSSSRSMRNITHDNRPNFFPTRGLQTYRANGQVYSLIGPAQADQGGDPSFMQVMFLPPSAQVDHRMSTLQSFISNAPISFETEKDLISDLTAMVLTHNRLICQFRQEFEQSIPNEQYMFKIRSDLRIEGVHPGRTNAQSAQDLGAAFLDNNNGDNSCDIVIMKSRAGNGSKLIRVPANHGFYEPATFPLLFTHGETGYSCTMRKLKPDGSLGSQVTANQHARFLAQVRPGIDHHFLNSGTLTLQWFAVTGSKIQQLRLEFIERNQSALRSDNYQRLLEVIETDHLENLNNIGRKVILPSSFSGSPRHLREYQQDCLGYVRRFGTPSLFVTFTANPKWEEIKNCVPEHLGEHFRPDIIARVFELKLKAFEKMVKDKNIFGEIVAYVWSIEWQKRGLPHAHILIWLRDRIRVSDVDKFISAEIPDESDIRYRSNIQQMIHGPCGSQYPNSPCMVNNKCIKGYPKQFSEQTCSDANGFIQYRRRSPSNGGNFLIKRIAGRDVEIDNRWIVPHNPFHLNFQNAHVCYELCGSGIHAIKYLFKYIFKGTDTGLVERLRTVPDQNEVKQFYAMKYISASEGAWIIYNIPRHVRSNTVERLPVHIENCQNITFRTNNLSQLLSDVLEPRDTKLTAFFKLCTNNSFAKSLLYSEVPEFFTWSRIDYCWYPRKRGHFIPEAGVFRADAFGRIYTVPPNAGEWFYLRLLLLHIRGPESFEHIRTIDGTMCETYHEACLKLHLLEGDSHWKFTLEEAALCAMPFQQRKLFATMLCFCSISNPLTLWNEFREILCDDYIHQYRSHNNMNAAVEITEFGLNSCFNQGLTDLNTLCTSMTNSKLSDFGMPMPVLDAFVHSNILNTMANENEESVFQSILSNMNSLTTEQREFFDIIQRELRLRRGGLHLLKASGGTGKTFLLNMILAKARLDKFNVVACASSGIAATNLLDGRTAHSVFRIPLNISEQNQEERAFCSISSSSPRGAMLRKLNLIVWDEVSASHKRHLEAVNNTLRDLTRKNVCFGGVLVILSGDYRQTLPVVRQATPQQQVLASIKFSRLWSQVVQHSLTINMRVYLQQHSNTESASSVSEFSTQLLQLGEGKLSTNPLPTNFYRKTESIEELLNQVFPEFSERYKDPVWLRERCILCPRNDSVEQINLKMLEKLTDHPMITIFSFDRLDASEENVSSLYPIEFLNSITPSGFPPHELKVKIGSPIIMLRNIDPPRLCNGTRLILTNLTNNLLTAKIMSGVAEGETVFLPRLRLHDDEDSYKFTRTQFPVKLAFSMTINKAQGQTMSVVGVDLTLEKCFSHGQLYVACSRVGSPQGLFINHLDDVENIVYEAASWDR